MHLHQRRIGGLKAVFGKIIATTLLIGAFAGVAPAKAAAPNPPYSLYGVNTYDGGFQMRFFQGANSIIPAVAPATPTYPTYEYSTDDGATFLSSSVLEYSPAADSDALCSDGEECIIVIPTTSAGAALVDGVTYQVRIRATNPDGIATSAMAAFPYTTGPVASPPTILSAVAYSNSNLANTAQSLAISIRILFGLNTHLTNPSSGLLEYSTDNGATYAVADPEMDRGDCDNLEECVYTVTQTSSGGEFAYGQSYDLRVRYTPDLRGAVQSTSYPFMFITGPGAPTITNTTAGNGAITIAYALGQDGGATVSTIQYSTDEGITWRNANCGSCASATGTFAITTTSAGATLAKGTSYEIQIRAKNRVGTSEASASALGHTLGAPMPPSLDNAIGSGAGIRVEGTLGLANGGTVIRVEYSTNGGTTWANTGQATANFTITAPSNNLAASLTAGTTYSVAIRTVTTIGTSAVSNIITVKPGAVPGTPTLSAAVGGGENIIVTGTLGAANGSAISLVEYSTDNGATWASSGQATASFTITETSATGADLVAGTTYQVRIRARNANGVSGASTAKSATPNSAPMPPSLESVSSSGAAISIRSTLGLTLGGTILRVEYSTDGGSTWATTGQATGTFTVTAPSSAPTSSLTAGAEYTVAVRSVSTAGTSGTSNTMKVIVGRTPAPPTIGTITTIGASLAISGTLGADNGTAVLRLEYSTDNGSTWFNAPSPSIAASTSTSTSTSTTGTGGSTATGATFSFTITAISSDGTSVINPATAYLVKVRAVTVIGTGAASAARRSIAAGAPNAPIITSVLSKNAGLEVNATLGNNNGAAATELEYSTDNGATWRSSRQTTGQFVITVDSASGLPLTADTTYDIKIRVINEVGTSAASNSYQERTYSRVNRIIFDTQPSTKAVGVAPWSIKARALSATPVSFRSNTPEVCDVEAGKVTVLEAGTCTLVAEVLAKDPYPGASRIYQFTVTNAGDGSSAGGGTGGNNGSVGTGNPADGVAIRTLAKDDGKAIAAKAKISLKNLTPGVCALKTVKGVRRVVGIADGACNIQIRINNKRTIVVNSYVETTDAGAVVKAGKPAA
jgi:hypothetical protein